MGRSGPSPTSTSTASTRRRMRANTCTTSRTCFTGRKLEMCITTGRPPGASAGRQLPSPAGAYSVRFTKLGMTSMAHPVQPNASYVSSRRYSDTAVTASDFSIENLVTVKNDLSCPTSVMSVPCSVVTILRSCRGRSISLARNAAVACGTA